MIRNDALSATPVDPFARARARERARVEEEERAQLEARQIEQSELAAKNRQRGRAGLILALLGAVLGCRCFGVGEFPRPA